MEKLQTRNSQYQFPTLQLDNNKCDWNYWPAIPTQ